MEDFNLNYEIIPPVRLNLQPLDNGAVSDLFSYEYRNAYCYVESKRCPFCNHFTFCSCSEYPDTTANLPPVQAPSATRQGKRDAASPPKRQEMESSNAVQTMSFPENPYTDALSSRITTSPRVAETDAEMPNGDDLLFQTPDPSRYVDHLHLSNVRDSAAEQQELYGPDSETRAAANILANGTVNLHNGDLNLDAHYYTTKSPLQQLDESMQKVKQLRGSPSSTGGLQNGQSEVPLLDNNVDPENAKAFAKLVFPDGDFFITTHDVMLGRNMDVFEQVRRQKKAQRRARDTLDSYRQEPSQPSQTGDADQAAHPSTSSQSLEGRPAPPSNISEHGGMVSYQAHSDGELDMQRGPKRKRRSLQLSKSSSTNSIAPASLHPSMMPDYPQSSLLTADGEPEFRTYASIPVHTQVPEDISKISKEHLLFSFNFKEERWELHIMGNRAFVNGHLFDKDDVIALEHNDEIIIATVSITFKLPDNFRRSPGLSRGTFSRASEDELSDEDDAGIGTSPVRRLSNAMEAGESDDEEQKDELEESNVRKKLKLSLKKSSKETTVKSKAAEKSGKSSHKRSKNDSPLEHSPEAAKKVEKGKKPKAAAKEPAAAQKEEKASPPSAPPHIEPGSALDGIPVDELPQKRKGPGRPPKNGLLSKRDHALCQKKIKEYEKRGEKAPPFDYLVQLVRAESKAKEQGKVLTGGPLPPDMSVVPSIETDAGVGSSRPMPAQSRGDADQTGEESLEQARKTSPNPKRTGRSLSPLKPESEYTEEELKKPTATYQHILDDILRELPPGPDGSEGYADLRDIYHLVAKKYPFFKYRVQSKGWESSVRHNLLQNDRFMEVGRSGKGRYWKVNRDVPMEKEKKRKVTPPPRPPMQNGQYMQQPPPHYGQPQYGNPYAQAHPNGPNQFNAGPQPGSSTYFSPYAQPGQHPGQGPNNQSHTHSSHTPAYPSQNPQNHHRPQQSDVQQPPGPFAALVSEIMTFRTQYLQPFFVRDKEEFETKQAMFVRVMNYMSDMYNDSPNAKDSNGAPPSTDEEKHLAATLDVLFQKHQMRKRTEAAQDSKAEASGSVQQAVDQAVKEENGDASVERRSPIMTQVEGAAIPAPAQADLPPTNSTPASAPGIGGVESSALQGQEVQVNAGSSGIKRTAEDADEEPDAKRVKED